jgi:hypothetical protein
MCAPACCHSRRGCRSVESAEKERELNTARMRECFRSIGHSMSRMRCRSRRGKTHHCPQSVEQHCCTRRRPRYVAHAPKGLLPPSRTQWLQRAQSKRSGHTGKPAAGRRPKQEPPTTRRTTGDHTRQWRLAGVRSEAKIGRRRAAARRASKINPDATRKHAQHARNKRVAASPSSFAPPAAQNLCWTATISSSSLARPIVLLILFSHC